MIVDKAGTLLLLQKPKIVFTSTTFPLARVLARSVTGISPSRMIPIASCGVTDTKTTTVVAVALRGMQVATLRTTSNDQVLVTAMVNQNHFELLHAGFTTLGSRLEDVWVQTTVENVRKPSALYPLCYLVAIITA